jgi:hypothetical protein
MRVIVAGDYKHPVLLNTTEATALLIETNDGKPNVIFKMLPDGEGWLRLTEGEDKNFTDVARQLGLI